MACNGYFDGYIESIKVSEGGKEGEEGAIPKQTIHLQSARELTRFEGSCATYAYLHHIMTPLCNMCRS